MLNRGQSSDHKLLSEWQSGHPRRGANVKHSKVSGKKASKNNNSGWNICKIRNECMMAVKYFFHQQNAMSIPVNK